MTPCPDPDLFGSALTVSNAAGQSGYGNPRCAAGMNGWEFARRVLTETGISFTETEDVMYTDKSPEYRAGRALAFYQWYSSCSFGESLSAVPLERIIAMYPVCHEMDQMMKKTFPRTRLRMRREFPALSGRSLRRIRRAHPSDPAF